MVGPASFLIDAFSRRYGAASDLRLLRAPGRVNLIGEHTDYNLGFVLPVAIELACFVACASSLDGRLSVYSETLQQSRTWPVEQIANVSPAGDWGDYIAGVARELIRAGYPLEPKNLLIRSTLPIGAGLGSSAALEVSCALALLGGRTMPRLELAQLCHRAETGFVGLPCGIMDQYVSVFGGALKIDCNSLRHEPAEPPPGVEILAVNSMVKHDLAASAYRQRVEECATAAEAARRRDPKVRSLRDVSSALLASLEESLPVALFRRARHVVSENQRVEAFIAASRRADLEGMGSLFAASHRSLKQDYEVSCEELDFLVDTAMAVPGVFGARMTGGGFGGCTVNLARPEAAAQFETTITTAYRERFGITPQIYRCRPSAGAGEAA